MRKPETFTEFLHLRFAGKLKDGRAFAKNELDRPARAAGVRTPEIYRTYADAAEIALGGLPDAFVLKPTFLYARRGVMVLHRITSDQGYWCSIHRRRYFASTVRDVMQRWQRVAKAVPPSARRFIAQERIFGENGNGIPFDYKLYLFNGEVKFIVQINRNGERSKVSFFLDEFRPCPDAGKLELTSPKSITGTPVVPRCAPEMVSAARALSRSLKTPFVRVDMYASTTGPVLGELTHTPGGSYFGMFRLQPEFDRELGTLWAANARAFGYDVPLFDPDEPRRALKRPRLLSAPPAPTPREVTPLHGLT